MGEIKSAREIAAEKIARLGSLSPEEIKKQQDERRRGAAVLLLSRFLGGLSLSQLQVELGKFAAEERMAVGRLLALRLLDELDLEQPDRRSKALEAIGALVPGDAVGNLLGQVSEVFSDWAAIEKSRSVDMEKSARDMLHQMRISGSAIAGINVRGNALWRESLRELSAPCESRLSELKRNIRGLLS